MDEQYVHWWQLHLKVAEGKELSAEEQIAYQQGNESLDQDELQQFQGKQPISDLIAMKTRIIELQIVHSQLELKSARLDARIAEMEQVYRKMTGLELSGEFNGGA
ncbi:MAG: hypothetical protein HUU38_16105 [Anaerolineales bacterium]|nr:hypothetical protein [Anaerolineales bacterium]